MESEKVRKVIDLAIDGCIFDGGHHKQWHLEEIIKAIIGEKGFIHLKKSCGQDDDGDFYEAWEEGIAP